MAFYVCCRQGHEAVGSSQRVCVAVGVENLVAAVVLVVLAVLVVLVE